jgi:hypothetical protein
MVSNVRRLMLGTMLNFRDSVRSITQGTLEHRRAHDIHSILCVAAVTRAHISRHSIATLVTSMAGSKRLRLTTSKRVHISTNSFSGYHKETLTLNQVIQKREESKKKRRLQQQGKPFLTFSQCKTDVLQLFAASTARARQLLADAALETGVDNHPIDDDPRWIDGDGNVESEQWHDVLANDDADDDIGYPSHDGEAIDDARRNALIKYASLCSFFHAVDCLR